MDHDKDQSHGQAKHARRPHRADHATAPSGSVDNKAVAAEMRHVADLLDANMIQLRNMGEVALADGWDRMTFDRKLDPSLAPA